MILYIVDLHLGIIKLLILYCQEYQVHKLITAYSMNIM